MSNHDETTYREPKSVRVMHDKVVELIRQHPGISKGEIAKLLYANKNTTDESNRLGSLLTHLCFVKRIKYQDVHRYSVIDAE